MNNLNDPILKRITNTLINEYKCHTVILYGSRARGLATSTSDYDILGVRKNGQRIRIAKKQNNFFWDVFIYSEKDLKSLTEESFVWRDAKIIFQKGTYGTKFLQRLSDHLKQPFTPHPKDEIKVLKVWAQKQLERCRVDNIQGLFRRVEFLNALIDHYFYVRQKRFLGPKEGFAWIEIYDPMTFKLIKRALKNPTNLTFLKAAAERVYKVRLN